MANTLTPVRKLDIQIRQGSTFTLPVMWELDTLVYKPITAVAQSAPVRLTVPGHGIPPGWMAAVANVKGPTALNAQNNPPKDNEFAPVTVIDADTVEFNKVNGAAFKAYAGGGQLVYYAPGDLTDLTDVRMQIRTKIDGPVLHELTLNDGIELDFAKSRIEITIPATDTELMTFKAGVYDLEVEKTDGTVPFPILHGAATLTREVTKPIPTP